MPALFCRISAIPTSWLTVIFNHKCPNRLWEVAPGNYWWKILYFFLVQAEQIVLQRCSKGTCVRRAHSVVII